MEITKAEQNLYAQKKTIKEINLSNQELMQPLDTDRSAKDYRFETKKNVKSELQQERMRDEYRKKEIEYVQHEFVKMNEVGSLITEAIQGVLDKIHQKDRTTQQNKNALRKTEQKLTAIEQ